VYTLNSYAFGNEVWVLVFSILVVVCRFSFGDIVLSRALHLHGIARGSDQQSLCV
jgi:hypothetical protein